MKELIRIILDIIYNEKEIPEDIFYEFMQKSMRIVQRKTLEEIPEEFSYFEHYVEMFWRGKKYNYISNPCMTYQMGQLFTCTSMLSTMIEEKEKEVSLAEYADLLRSRYRVFDGMYNERGITHKKLADISDMSVSSLSQFLNRIKTNGFFTYRIMGREKHYYLTEYGTALLQLMAAKDSKKKMKYVKLRDMIDNMNEAIENDPYYKIAYSQDKDNSKESVYITNQEYGESSVKRLMNISIDKGLFNQNKEESEWQVGKTEIWNQLSKIL